MLKRFKLLLLAPFLVLALGFAPALVLADCAAPSTSAEAISCGTNNAAGVPQNTDAGKSLDSTITNVINLMSVVVGVAAVVMIIVGGLRYIISAGKDESVKTAKNTILYAIIGLVIVALAQIIVQFVLDKTTQSVDNPKPTSDVGGNQNK